jgi:hypothetical protein
MQQISIENVAGKAAFNRFHGLILFWCALIVIFDGYDLAVVGAALPAIMDDMQIDARQAGVMAGSALMARRCWRLPMRATSTPPRSARPAWASRQGSAASARWWPRC